MKKLLLLNLGSNIRPEYHLRAAARALRTTWPNIRFSPVYRSAAAGFNGPAFLNAGAALHCDWSLAQIQRHLRTVENTFHRCRRARKFSSRTLDIDLLAQGSTVCATAVITLPRADILRYSHVLVPLCDLVPDALHPQLLRRYASLVAQLPINAALQRTRIVL